MKKSVRSSTIEGRVRVPASKSVMQRVAAAALLAGPAGARILNPSTCDDARAALGVISALGAEVVSGPGEVVVTGGLSPRKRELDCRESGLCLRLFSAVAGLWHEELVLTGRGSLMRRPADILEGALAGLGVSCRTRGGFPPVSICGPLRGGRASLDGSVSSQVLTGLLMALPLAAADSELVVAGLRSRPYVDMTLGILRDCGIRVENEGYERFRVSGGQSYRVGTYTIEGDWSAAAPLCVAAAVAGRLRVTGLDPASPQADKKILDVLEAAGAAVSAAPGLVTVEKRDLRAFVFDAGNCPDLVPPLTALACHCRGTSRILGAGRLRYKESDRAAVLAAEFGRLGARIALGGDVLEVMGGPLSGGEASAHGDHRIVMALAAAAVGALDPVVIEGAESVAKSYPLFFRDLAAAGGRIDE